MRTLLLGLLARVRVVLFLRITMFGDGTRRIDRWVHNPADLVVRFMVGEELFPVLDTLQDVSHTQRMYINENLPFPHFHSSRANRG